MIDAVLGLLHGAVTSLWVYPALFVCAMLDGVVPVFPAETLVITAGLYAAQGRPSLLLVVVLAAAGACAGDHIAYLLGRASGGRIRAWAGRGPRREAAFAWAERGLAVRGGLVLVAARYVAGGRNATTLTMGAVGYPLRSFSSYDVVGAGSWALFSALLGYVGGVAFEQHPVKGLLFGLSTAVAIMVLAESLRTVRRRRARRADTGTSGDSEASNKASDQDPGLEESFPAGGHAA